MDEYGHLIGKALLSESEEGRAKQLRRIACKTAASTLMTCRCGVVLDQKTVCVLEDNKGATGYVGCPRCAKRMEEAYQNDDVLPDPLKGAVWSTWDEEQPFGELFLTPEERAEKPVKPAPNQRTLFDA